MKTVTRLILLVVLGSFLAVGNGCAKGPGTTISGGSPAAPPSPPAELPVSLRIPSGEDLSISVDKVASGAVSPSESVALKSDAAASGEFSDNVNGIGDSVKFIEDDLTGLLDPYSQLVIPVGTNIHTFQGLSVVQDVGDVVFVHMKIDFADFGGNGCSGNTARLPICMRIWADGKRAMTAVFTAFPTDTNPGAGRLMGLNVSNGVFLFPEGAFLGINYDQHDPSTGKSVELLTREEDPAGFRVHLSLDQEGEEATAIKTIGASLTGGKIGTDSVQAIMRYKEDGNLLSGNIHFVPLGGPTAPEMIDQCVDLLTGNGVETSQCILLGIDIDETPFLSFPDETDVFLPEDFPESPTFL